MADWFEQNAPTGSDWFSANTPGTNSPLPAPGDVEGRKAWMRNRYPQYQEAPKQPSNGIGDVLTGVGNTISGMAGMAKRVLTPPQTPGDKAASLVAGPLGPIAKDIIQSHVETGKKAVEAAKQGDVSSAAGYGAATVLPGAGPWAASLGEKVGEGKYAEAGGELVSGLAAGKATQKAPAIGRAVSEVPGKVKTALLGPFEPTKAISQALKPKSTNVQFRPGVLDRAMPEIKASEPALGRPISGVDDMLTAVNDAKQRVWKQYQDIAGPQSQRGIDLSPVADAIERSIPQTLELENPTAAAAIRRTAQQYRRPFTIQEAEQFLREKNAELNAYYSKYPTAQRRVTTANPDTASTEAAASALRDTIYRSLDDAGDGSAPAELKRRYGSLLNVEEELYRRKNVAERQAPNSLSEQLGSWHAAGQAVRGAMRLPMDPLGGAADIAKAYAERKVSRFLKEQNMTDNLIRRAFEVYGKTPSPVPYTPTPIRGLLTEGSIKTPPPPDRSGGRVVSDTYPADRLPRLAPPVITDPGRMIPPPQKPPIVTPPPPDTSGPIPGGIPAFNSGYGEGFWTPRYRQLRQPDIVTPVPPDPSGVWAIPAQYAQKMRPGRPRPLLAAPEIPSPRPLERSR